ncbi:unnamed protein product, partial [marine sediment metagenome]
ILIGHREKIPIEKNWPTTANYSYNGPKLLEHLKKNRNYGVIGSENHIIIDVDTPEIQKAVEEHLPSTFTVRTGRGGKHYYYICKIERPIRLRDKDLTNIGEIQGAGKQVVGPTCIHPNGKTYEIIDDRLPVEVHSDSLKEALKDFIITKQVSPKGFNGMMRDGISSLMVIEEVHSPIDMRKCGNRCHGSHPVHGSTTGMNFWIDLGENVWHCFRHNTGGGPLSLLAVKEGIILCEEATRGALRGEKFKKTLSIALKRRLINV